MFSYFCKLTNQGKTRKTKRGKVLENFHKNSVCKAKAKPVNKENISVVEITITRALGISRVTTNNLTNGQNLWAWGVSNTAGGLGVLQTPPPSPPPPTESLRQGSSGGI